MNKKISTSKNNELQIFKAKIYTVVNNFIIMLIIQACSEKKINLNPAKNS